MSQNEQRAEAPEGQRPIDKLINEVEEGGDWPPTLADKMREALDAEREQWHAERARLTEALEQAQQSPSVANRLRGAAERLRLGKERDDLLALLRAVNASAVSVGGAEFTVSREVIREVEAVLAKAEVATAPDGYCRAEEQLCFLKRGTNVCDHCGSRDTRRLTDAERARSSAGHGHDADL